MDTAKFSPWNTLPGGVALSKPVLGFLTEKLGFPGAAPVQYSVVPLMLKGKDVVVEAITGSGKTLAFLIPAAEALLSKRGQAACKESRHNVVVCCLFPTRELAQQVHSIAQQMIQYINQSISSEGNNNNNNNNNNNASGNKKNNNNNNNGLYRVACFVGGHDVAKDIALFQEKGAHLLLGTPGRLNELLVTCRESVSFELRSFEMLVLDEADRLLECGFKPTLTSLLKRFPKQRRTALFSATQSRELADLARAGTKNPLLVTVREHQNFAKSQQQQQDDEAEKRRRMLLINEDNSDDERHGDEPAPQNPDRAQVPMRLRNWYHVTKYANKLDALVNYLRPIMAEHKILVYVMTCAGVEWLHAALSVLLNNNNNLFALHGQLSMDQRKKVHKAAAAAKAATIICSDVAARGLDLPNVRYVVQFDAPSDPRTFVHRIGRTARMGQAGDSLLLLSPMETDYIHFLQLQNVFVEKLPKEMWANRNNDDNQQDGAAATEKEFGDTDDDDEEDEDFDDVSKIVVNKNRTLASVASDRNKLKAARGRVSQLALKKQQLKQERRSQVTTGDLSESPSILALRRSIAFNGNDALLQKAARAFVSFIRAYKEHECRHIFRLQHIDITDLTNGFALFFVPNCGEIRLMHHLHIPLQPEFDAYTKQLDKQRKETQAERFAAERAKKSLREKQLQQLRSNNGIDLVLDADGNVVENQTLVKNNSSDAAAAALREDAAAATGVTVVAGRKKSTIHEMAQEEKQRIRDSHVSQTAKKRAWARAELDELRREAFLVKKEKRGKISSARVTELIGDDKIDHAMMSTRERRDQNRRRTRSE